MAASVEVRQALSLLLVEWGAGGTIEEAEATVAFFPPRARSGVEGRLRRYAAAVEEPLRWAWKTVVGEDWADAWKEHFRPLQVSPRLAICPSWIAWDPPEPNVRVLRLDPGRAFGTGTHETTRLCLTLLDEATAQAPFGSFLDVGCGSGILTCAAGLLGVRRLVALDIDPVAVAATRENAARNGIADPLLAFCGELRAVKGSYDLVAANILYQILVGLAPHLVARTAPGGRLILSGFLGPELPAAKALYRNLGMEVLAREFQGEWGALMLARR